MQRSINLEEKYIFFLQNCCNFYSEQHQPIFSSYRGKEGVSGGNGRRVTSPYASAVADYLGKSVLVCPFCSLS